MFVIIQIAAILFIGYVVYISLCHTLCNQSLDDAKEAVDKSIKKAINNYIFKQTIPQEPVPDKVFLNRLFGDLQTVNMIGTDSTAWQFNPNFYGFPVISFDIVANSDTNFDFLCIQLKKTAENYLIECEFMPVVYVYAENHSDSEYYVFVCYAVYEPAQTAMRKFIENRAVLNRKKALRKIAPVINKQLENELSEMDKAGD